MRVPFTDVRVEYMDTHERRVLDLREDGLAEIPLLGWYSYTHARPDLPVHCHRGTVEICFMERGSQVFQIEDQEYRLGGGEVLVTFPDEPHSTAGQPSEPCVLYWLNLRLPKPGRPLLSLPGKESDLLAHSLKTLPRRHFPGSPLLKTLFDRLLALHGHAEIALHPLRMRQAMLQLLLEIIDDSTRYAQSDRSRLMTDVIRTIQSQPAAEFRLEDLARQAGLSLSRFKARFKLETGMAPRHFIQRTKIEFAEERLTAGRDSISKIAMDLGFPTAQYFATVFRRFKGISARAYRREAARPHGPSHRREDGQQ